ncbi:MAG: hypothetical protein ABIK28_09925 [Planctomycetota bacterium]
MRDETERPDEQQRSVQKPIAIRRGYRRYQYLLAEPEPEEGAARHADELALHLAAGCHVACAVKVREKLVGAILWNNFSPFGKEISVSGASTVSILFFDMEGGQADVHIEQGSQPVWGQGRIDEEPLFVDPLQGDHHIEYGSPCRDTGDSAASGLSDTDFEGDPRVA